MKEGTSVMVAHAESHLIAEIVSRHQRLEVLDDGRGGVGIRVAHESTKLIKIG